MKRSPLEMALLSGMVVELGVAVFLLRERNRRKQIDERLQKAEEELRQANAKLGAQLEEIPILQAQLREQAIRDAVTGLFNRRYMQETLDRILAHALRDQTTVSIMMIDIDHFKKLNDTSGHQAGDCVLQALGHLITANTRQMDVACRFGGEEFVVIMPAASLEDTCTRAEGLRQAVANLQIEYDGQVLSTTISIGVVVFPLHGYRSSDLLNSADRALYAAQAAGRNCVIAYQEGLAQ